MITPRELLARQLEGWQKMDKKYKLSMVAVLVMMSVWLFVAHQTRANADQVEQTRKREQAEQVQAAQAGGSGLSTDHYRALPTDNRNQGLETLSAQLRLMQSQLEQLKTAKNEPARQDSSVPSVASPPLSNPLSTSALPPLPPVVDPAATAMPPVNFAGMDASQPVGMTPPPAPQEGPRLKMNSFAAAQKTAVTAAANAPDLVIPVNAGIEAVLLSGLNASPSGATGGAVGSVTSATQMGTPFISKIKGQAILPNGWKVPDLSNCFLSGNGIANANAERVNVIANRMSCLNKKGELWEADVKAYGLDVDGIQGLAGHTVSKQGRILMQAALTGLVSGLSAALSPTALPAYNSTADGGKTQYQLPNPDMLAQSMLGTGLSQATSQLSRFYLQYASQVMPVIEVPAGTRVTWILTETIKLKKARLS